MANNNKRLLITGATGFIGQALTQELLNQDFQIKALVRQPDALKHLNVQMHQGDITNPDSLDGIETQIDTVIHCAASLGKWGVAEQHIHQINVQGSLNLLRRFKGKKLHRFIYLSAGGVTGPIKEGIADEDSQCHPATAYERSKHEAEKQLLHYAETHHIPLIIVRPTFTYGPGDNHKLALFRAVKKKRFAFIGTGDSLVSPVYIDDVVRGILLTLDNGLPGQTYIITGPKPVSKLELIGAIAEAQGIATPDIKIPYRFAWLVASILETISPLCCNFQPILTRSKVMMMGDNFGYSGQKADSELNYHAKVSLHQGIEQTVQDYQNRNLL